LNLNDNFGFAQLFTEVLVFAAQFLILFIERVTLGLGTPLLGRQGMQDAGGALLSPGHQVRGVQALAAEQGAQGSRLLFRLIGFSQDALLVLSRKNPAFGFGDDLGIGPGGGTGMGGGFACRSTPSHYRSRAHHRKQKWRRAASC
jgi:hypothetical protein